MAFLADLNNLINRSFDPILSNLINKKEPVLCI
jgi:hypothetical protein